MDYNLELINTIPINKRVLFLIIGLPGSGKSTYANNLSKQLCINWKLNEAPKIFEADMYFMKNGKYCFDKNKIRESFFWCQVNTVHEMLKGNPVIVANPNLTPASRYIYITIAKLYNYQIAVHECSGNFQNLHNINEEDLNNMKNRYKEFNVSELELFTTKTN